jgi:Tfp pilus assembly protein PilV
MKTHADRNSASAFTFVEVFAAMLFLAILVPAIVEALNISSKAADTADRGAIAGELAENKLNELIVEQTSQEAQGQTSQTTSNTSGDFGTDYPGFTWTMNQQQWTQDTVNTVTEMDMEVSYPVQGVQRSFKLTTLISGSNAAAQGGL